MAIISNLIERVNELEEAVMEIREALASRAPAPKRTAKKAEKGKEGHGVGT